MLVTNVPAIVTLAASYVAVYFLSVTLAPYTAVPPFSANVTVYVFADHSAVRVIFEAGIANVALFS